MSPTKGWCGKHFHGPLTRYVKLRVAHAQGMSGTFSPPPRVSDPDMNHGTCATHVPWCMPGSRTSGHLWRRWRGKHSRHSRRMRSLQYHVAGKRHMSWRLHIHALSCPIAYVMCLHDGEARTVEVVTEGRWPGARFVLLHLQCPPVVREELSQEGGGGRHSPTQENRQQKYLAEKYRTIISRLLGNTHIDTLISFTSI